jgi:hypothetical protein
LTQVTASGVYLALACFATLPCLARRSRETDQCRTQRARRTELLGPSGTISGETRDTYVVTNNHNLGKATVNAFELQALFGKRINPPARLVQAYPELEQLALNSGSG